MSEVIVNRFQSLAIRRFAVVFTGATPRRDDPANWDGGTIPWINSGAVNQRRIVRHSSLITKQGFQSSSTKWIPAGSVVIAMAGQGKTKGMAATVERPMTGNQSLAALIVNRRIMDYRYLAFALEPEYRNLRGVVGNEERSGLSLQDIRSFKIPVPSLEEQGLMVRYLDHAELRIAKAIAAKTELARLLQQQRLALLCSEVLGRDEDKDNSRDFGRLVERRVLDWVGPVPKSWDVVPMSGVFDVVKQRNIGLIENTVLSLSYGRVVIKPAEKLRGLVPESFETYQIIEPGDVIVRPTDLQNDTTSLRIGQARDRGIITSAYIALRPKKHVDPDYVMMQLAAYDFLKVLYGFGSGLRQNLDFKHLKHVPMMLPRLAEQSAIVSRVRAKTKSVEQAHAAILQEIALLKEYRTRLISDVVTGKLDVHQVAAKLPEIDPMELANVVVGENDDEGATDDD